LPYGKRRAKCQGLKNRSLGMDHAMHDVCAHVLPFDLKHVATLL
jgi:hypothetical protein